ncbi:MULTISPECIES: organic hydroperoxide resistance protein [Arthrobacter]|uniref:Organic hydroperoxide resistance protein n=1 Tax=Arthrobacter jinronghuae TaxID=2964609 RepID=A0ABT1NN26_9MICC|nr:MULTISPECIES: organic hydroperoxide resistance protein [Arthrobacter]MCQ1949050.1 organic hydroperoxide resistance protein [Arthrobacter jinronghuae]MCQ1952376.1 organic hydroperoxide resistance protein [Arthrobacter sp. zg-Y238]MCQ1955507.1 organic hydroperoxide resistance protein [Arthrobacter jinronghuae]UWX78154.1 organic hydroperoxide resistance protein [Arthrobacter jinronghuae]
MSALYTAAATATGDGRNGEARTSDGKLEVNLSTPTEMGGSGEGTNPEQLFATGYAACFLSALKMIARAEKAPISDAAVTADVSIFKNDDGGFKLGVELHVEMSGVDEATADKLTQAAHQVCPYSNATRGNIDVNLDVTVG